MKLSVIIPNYNGEKLLINNLPKVIEAVEIANIEYEIIISDDNSTDSSVETINEFIEKSKNNKTHISLIINSENKGFASNVNRAVENAKGEFLILLNTDVIPSRNFLNSLLPHFKDGKLFAVGCMDESVEGGKLVMRGRGKGEWKRGFLSHSAATIKNGQTLWVAGGSGAFRRNIWEELGGFDSLYDPFYWEDIDLSYRARKAGYLTIFEKNSIVRHEHEKGAIKTKFKSDEIKKIAYRNQFIFAWKNSDFDTLISGIFWLPYHLIKAIISKDLPLLFGFMNAIMVLPVIISSRKNVHKLFTLKDKQVIEAIT